MSHADSEPSREKELELRKDSWKVPMVGGGLEARSRRQGPMWCWVFSKGLRSHKRLKKEVT